MKKRIGVFRTGVILLALLSLAGCGGGGGGGETEGAVDTPVVDPVNGGGGSTTPAIAGFDIILQEGDFWEYRWDYYSNSWAQGSSPSTTLQTGRFRVTLGSPVSAAGYTAFPLQVSGADGYRPASGTPTLYAPRWQYLAKQDNLLFGSIDGSNFSLIFDAQNGFWPGGGYFTNLGSVGLNQALLSTIAGTSNVTQYISGSAYKTGLSDSQSTCQYYPGVGTICGDSSYNYRSWEYFRPDIGPLGYYYYNSFSDCGGGFCSGATWEEMVGLVSSSLQGDTVDYILENEPNDAPAAPQILTNQQTVMGLAFPFAAGWDVTGLGILVGADTFGWSLIEDLYKFTLPLSATQRQVTITLRCEGATGTDTDYDIYLLNGTGSSVIASSTSDNVATGVYEEQITYLLGSGPYLIGVEAFSNSDKVEYKLSVSW